MSTAAYVIITPARNEGAYLQHTIDSIVAQTLPPRKWVIVNDGSTDQTREIADAAAARHPWIQAVHRADRGFRSAGTGVMEAFYDGFGQLGSEPWDYLVKLDGDLSFDPDYFARCIERFVNDAKLGIGGGTICSNTNGTLVPESAGDPLFHVRGATKIYRRACWDAIGGLIWQPGWDTLDEIKANMLGWTTCSFPELKLAHHRHTGDADGSWKNWVKNGRANYIVGYHPAFMLCKCIRRLFTKPYAIAGIGLFAGFCSGYLKGIPATQDKSVTAYLRRQQINRLFLRPSIWKG